MKRHRSVNLLLMLVLLVAVGQMAQTIYIPAIADMARELNVREGAVQSVMAAYLLTYGLPQFFFHVTTAYALLRHNGVEIGKKDYMGT